MNKTQEATKVIIDPEVFNDAYVDMLYDTTQTQIVFGGASSGKSYFLAERVVFDLLGGKRNYLICRKVGKYVMKSVWIEVENVIDSWGVRDLFDLNKSERTITCENGKQAIFTGLDEPQKLKSIRAKNGSITDIWIEEATEVEPSDLKELEKRQRGGEDGTHKRVVLSFNPILQDHWIYADYFAPIEWADTQTDYQREGLRILKTTYKNNRFLTKQDIDRLENEGDKYYRDVYTLGNWGVLGNVIFTNWTVEDLSLQLGTFDNHYNGLDFGFSADPAAMTVTHYDRARKTIYVYNELYERELTNDILADVVGKMIDKQPVFCDSAEPKSIAELRQYGINARPVKKGKDSVLHGIQWLQQQKIVIHKSCTSTISEFRQYKWKEDKNGKQMMQPVDNNNHIIDALRYAYELNMIERQTARSWSG